MFTNCPFESSLDIKKDCMICIKNLEKTILGTGKKQKPKSYFIKKSKYNSSPTLIDQSLFAFLREFEQLSQYSL